MLTKINETSNFLAAKMIQQTKIGMITGTGLDSITQRIKTDFSIPYEDIPNFPRSTTEGHKGTLSVGTMADKPVIAMEGRFHLYEGYTPNEITFPVRVMASIGVKYLLISSAAGGLDPRFEAGDLMLLTDHVNLTGTNPLIGPNLNPFGPRFPDMTRIYDPDLLTLATETALKSGIMLRQGVYAGVVGPSLETRAETRFLRMIGCDAVGMSTVSEAIVGGHCGLKIIAIAVITNVNLPDCMKETSIEEIIAVANRAGNRLGPLWEKIITGLPVTD